MRSGRDSRCFERYGLRLEERPLAGPGSAERARAASDRPAPAWSVSDRMLALVFAAVLLAYVSGIGLGLRWALRWLSGA